MPWSRLTICNRKNVYLIDQTQIKQVIQDDNYYFRKIIYVVLSDDKVIKKNEVVKV